MNCVEIIRGIGNVVLVMALAGAVAYVGDRVGHQVGRRRLSLFGIRPRYTSTIVAIATGMLIALVVTLVAIFASQEVKTAFFKLNTINQQISELQARQRDLEAKVNSGPARFSRRHPDGAVLSDHRPVGYRQAARNNDSRLIISSQSSTSMRPIRGSVCARMW